MFSVNRHSLTTRLLLIERSERDDLDSRSNHRLSDAVNAVRNKEMTKHGAARHFGVPRSTLSDRLRTAKEEKEPAKFTKVEESEIKASLINLASLNVVLSERRLVKLIAEAATRKGMCGV